MTFFLGCSPTMKESTNLNFSLNNGIIINNLDVNIYIYKKKSGSKWYGLLKKLTIVHNGKLLIKNINISDVSYYEIYVFTPNFVKVDSTDNIFKDNLMDFYYSFSTDHIDFEINKDNKLLSKGKLYYEKDFKNSSVNKFIFYDSNNQKFDLTELGPDTLNYLDSMTFEELIETDKLLSKDILKLKKLSFAQKKQLIEAHKIKKFDITFN